MRYGVASSPQCVWYAWTLWLACVEYNTPSFLSVYGKQSSTFRCGGQSRGARNPKLHGHILKIWCHFLGLVHSKYNLFWLLTQLEMANSFSW